MKVVNIPWTTGSTSQKGYIVASDVGSKRLGHIDQNDGCLFILTWGINTLGYMPSVKILAFGPWLIHFEELYKSFLLSFNKPSMPKPAQ